jgi:hypothetical protein
MSVITSGTCTIGGLSLNLLRQVESGFEGGDTTAGKVARSWTVSALVTSAQATSLYNLANTWRADRLDDEDSVASQSVGTTVAFEGVACWFSAMPSITPLGAYYQADFTVVDAAQALAIATKEQEDQANEGLGRPDLGTFSLGGVTITLTQPMETVGTLPTLARTSTGQAYITGPLIAPEVREVTGTVANAAAYSTLVNWVISTSQSVPSSGSWFPVSAPRATAEHKIVDGLKVVEYTVSITVEKV